MSKPKVGFYWCAACGGCDEAVVDLEEDILQVVGAVDIVFWPVALDFKREDVEKLQDGELAACFINGAIRTSEQFEMVEILRKKAGLLIAFEAALTSANSGIGESSRQEAVLSNSYKEVFPVVNPEGTYLRNLSRYRKERYSPGLWNTVKSLDQVTQVDYYLPGCPPPVELIKQAVFAILEGKLPEKGAVLAPDKALCEVCPRRIPNLRSRNLENSNGRMR